MDQNAKAFIVNKLGALMLSNAELAAENMELVKRGKDKDVVIAELRKQIEKLKLPNLSGAGGSSSAGAGSTVTLVGGAAGNSNGAGAAGGDNAKPN